MGGLAGGRYIGPRGTTTGDATGGGGRSVMPNRDFLNALAERRRRQMLRNQMIGSGGGGAPATQQPHGPLVPPGGGYSGGVIPRFQAGGVPVGAARREYLLNTFPGTFYSGAYGGSRREWDRDERNKAAHIQQAQRNLAPPQPRGWQAGRTVNPRAGGESAMQRQRRMQWNNNMTGAIPAGWGPYGSPFSANARFPSPPGGWQAGGQFPEPSFPVENQLSDESPWYPDEEVGYEEAAPMQGGFDVFGRGGG